MVTIEPMLVKVITVSDSSTISRSIFAAMVKTSSMARQLISSASPLKLRFLTTSSFSEHGSSVFNAGSIFNVHTSSMLVTKRPTLMKVMTVSDSSTISRSIFAATVKTSMARQLNSSASKEPKLFLLYVTLGPLLGFLFVLCLCRSYLQYKQWLARRRNRRVSLHEHPSEIELIGLGSLEPCSESKAVPVDTAL